MIITIDGPVATGKSTIAQLLADQLVFIFFDTGAMYRAVTYGILKNQVDIDSAKELQQFLDEFHFDIKRTQREYFYFIGDEDITKKIRGRAVTESVSRVSANKLVRDYLVEKQRNLSKGINAVFEGRDMGTVVFPEAEVKVFLTGRPEVRARRRHREFLEKNPEEFALLTIEQCLKDILERDRYDSSREVSPLRQAKDAFVVDTSDLTIEEVVFKILEYKDNLTTKRP